LLVPSILGTRIGVRVVRCLVRVVWGFDGIDYVGFVGVLLGLQGLYGLMMWVVVLSSCECS
jgi:hypothetical protein